MHLGQLQVIACGLLASCLAAGCGASDAESRLAVRISTLRLSSGAADRLVWVNLRLHNGANDCDVIRLSGMDARAPYETKVNYVDGAAGIENIKAGRYTAVAWGLDDNQSPLCFACEPDPVDIEDGVEAYVELTLDPY